MKKSIERLLYTKEPRQLDYMGLTRTELDFILANSKQQLQKVIIHNEIAFRIQTRDEAIQIPHQTKVCWGFIIPSFRKVLPTHLTPALHEFLMTCVRNVLFWDKKDSFTGKKIILERSCILPFYHHGKTINEKSSINPRIITHCDKGGNLHVKATNPMRIFCDWDEVIFTYRQFETVFMRIYERYQTFQQLSPEVDVVSNPAPSFGYSYQTYYPQ